MNKASKIEKKRSSKLTKQIKQGVRVRVIAGNDKGREGNILNIKRLKSSVKVKVQNVSVKTGVVQTQGQNKKFVKEEAFIDVSNIKLVDEIS